MASLLEREEVDEEEKVTENNDEEEEEEEEKMEDEIDEEILFLNQDDSNSIDGLLSLVTGDDNDSTNKNNNIESASKDFIGNDPTDGSFSSTIRSTKTLWNWMVGATTTTTTSSIREEPQEEEKRTTTTENNPSNNNDTETSYSLLSSMSSIPLQPQFPKVDDDTYNDIFLHPDPIHNNKNNNVATVLFSNNKSTGSNILSNDYYRYTPNNDNDKLRVSEDEKETETKEEEDNWGEEGSFVSYDTSTASISQDQADNLDIDDDVSRHGIRKKEMMNQIKKQHYYYHPNHHHHHHRVNHRGGINKTNNNYYSYLFDWKQTLLRRSLTIQQLLWNRTTTSTSKEMDETELRKIFPPSYDFKKRGMDKLMTLGLGLSAHGLGLNNDNNNNANTIIQSILHENDNNYDNNADKKTTSSSSSSTNDGSSRDSSSSSSTTTSSIWWIQDLKKRNCLGHDTNTIPPIQPKTKQSHQQKPLKVQIQNPVIDALLPNNNNNNNNNNMKDSSENNDDNHTVYFDDDSFVSMDSQQQASTTKQQQQQQRESGNNNKKDIITWKDLDERFWTAARTYHLEAYSEQQQSSLLSSLLDTTTQNDDDDDDDDDDEDVSKSHDIIRSYYDDYKQEDSKLADQIKEFKCILKLCLNIYIRLFHTHPTVPHSLSSSSSQNNNEDDGTVHCVDDNLSSKDPQDSKADYQIIDPIFPTNEKHHSDPVTSDIKSFSSPNKEEKNEREFQLKKVSPYVPLSVTLVLFQKIIQYYHHNKNKNDRDCNKKEDVIDDANHNEEEGIHSIGTGDVNTHNDSDEYSSCSSRSSSEDEFKDSIVEYSLSSDKTHMKDEDTLSTGDNNNNNNSNKFSRKDNNSTLLTKPGSSTTELDRELAKIVLKALLSPEMNIFHYYEVNLYENNDNVMNGEGDEDQMDPSTTSIHHHHHHQLFRREIYYPNRTINRNNSKTTMNRQELEEFLYGDDDDSSDEDDYNKVEDIGIGNKGNKNDNVITRNKKQNQLRAKKEKQDQMDDKKEIRLKMGIVQYFTDNNNKDNSNDVLLFPSPISDDESENKNAPLKKEWNFVFSQHILLESILCQRISIDNSSGQFSLHTASSSSSSLNQRSSGIPAILEGGTHRDPLLSELYALKYLPLFLFRSMIIKHEISLQHSPSSHQSEDNDRVKSAIVQESGKNNNRIKDKLSASASHKMYNEIKHERPELYFQFLLLNQQFLESSHFAFGPFQTTTSILQEWESFQSYTDHIFNKMILSENNRNFFHTKYLDLHDALSSTLEHIRDTVSKDDSNNRNDVRNGQNQELTTTSRSLSSNVDSLLDSSEEKKVYHPRVMSCCAEIGRSFYHLGICLGSMQQQKQDRASSASSKMNQQTEETSKNERMNDHSNKIIGLDATVSIELSAYENSIRSYRQSLTFLSTSESSLLSSLELNDHPLEVYPDRSNTDKDRKFQLELQLNQIRDAKMSTELYLADVMSAAGYCYDAKLSLYEKALSFYIDARKYYTSHIGTTHITVANTLQNIGTIYFELKRWDEAITVFNDRVSTLEKLMENDKPLSKEDQSKLHSDPSSDSFNKLVKRSLMLNDEIAFTYHSLATTYAEKGNYESALRSNTDAIKQMRRAISNVTNNSNVIIDQKRRNFISVVLSEIGYLHIHMSSKVQSKWYSHCFRLLYSSNVFDWTRDRTEESYIARIAHLEWSAINSFDESIKLRIQHKKSISINYSLQHPPFSISSFGLFRSEESEVDNLDSSNDSDHIDSINTNDIETETPKIGSTSEDHLSVKENTTSDLLQLAKDLYCVGKLRFHQKDYRSAAYDLSDALILLLSIASFAHDNQDASENALNDGDSLTLEAILLCNFRFLSIKLLSLLSSALTRLEHFDKAMYCLTLALSIYQKETKIDDEGRNESGTNHALDDIIEGARLFHKLAYLHFNTQNYEESINFFRSALRIYDNAASKLETIENGLKTEISEKIETNAKRSEDAESEPTKRYEDMGRDIMENVEDTDSTAIHTDSSDVRQMYTKHLSHEINIKNNLALLLYSLGKSYYNLHKLSKARRCFEDAIEILDSDDQNILVQMTSEDFSLNDMRTFSSLCIDNLQIERIHFSPSVIMSCLGDTYRRIGKSFLKQDLRHDALLSFERSIEILEGLTVSIVSQITRDDDAIDIIDDVKLDSTLLECYECVLDFLGNRRLDRKVFAHDSILTGWGMKNREHNDKNIDFQLTKEDVLFRMGNIYARRRHFTKAIKCYTEAEDLTVHRLGTRDHIIVANLLHNMGNVFKDMCMLVDEGSSNAGSRAIKLFEDSIKISTSTHGPDHPSVAESKNNMAHVLLHLSSLCVIEEKKDSQQKTSLHLFEQSIQIITSNLGESHIVVVDALQAMGILYIHRDDIDNASLILGKVLKDQQLLFGPSHSKIGETSYFIGKVHILKARKAFKKNANEEQTKELNLALKFLLQSFEIFRREVTNSSCDGQYNDDGSLDATKKLKQRKLHISVSNTMLDIALVQQALGRNENAKMFLNVTIHFLQSHVLKSQAQGEESSIYRELSAKAWGINAELNSFQGDLSCSIDCYMESLNFIGKALDTSLVNSEYTNQLLLLGSIYSRNNQPEKALRCYAVCLSTFISQFGNDCIEVASIFQMMGREHLILGDKRNSLKCYRAAFHVYSRTKSEQASHFEKGMKGILHQHYGEIVLNHGVGTKEEAYRHFNSAVTLIEDVRAQHISSKIAILYRENSALDEIYRISLSIDSWDHRLMKCYTSILKLTKFVLKKENEVEETADVLHRIGNIYTVFENYDKAMLCFFEVLHFQRSSQGDDHLSVADLLFNIGNIYFQKRDNIRALECHEESYRISLAVLGGNSWEMLEHLKYLQTISYELCRYRDSIFWSKKALDIIRQHTSDKELLLLTLQQMGNTYEKCGEYQQALQCFHESLDMGRKIWNENDFRIANILNSLGNVHRLLRESDNSFDFYDECMKISLQNNEIVAVAKVKDDIASLLALEGNITSSEKFVAEALYIKTINLGCDDIEVARTLCNLAKLYTQLSTFDRALSYLQEGMRILRLNLAEDHDEIAAGLYIYGRIYDHQNQQKKALKYYSDALAIFRDKIRSDNMLVAKTLYNIGCIYRRMQNFETAATYFLGATNAYSFHFGHNHELTADARCCLGYALYELKQFDESLTNITDVVKARIICFGRHSPLVSETILILGRIYAKLNNFKDALFCLKEGLQFTQNSENHDWVEISDSEVLLANVYVAMNKNDKAVFHFKEAIRMKNLTSNVNKLDLAEIHLQLGACLLEIGSYSSSMEHLQKSLQMKTLCIGADTEEVSFILKKIGQLQRQEGNVEGAIDYFRKALAITLSIGTQYCVAELYFELGQCHFSVRNFPEALRLFSGSSKILKAINDSDTLSLMKDVMVYQASAFFSTSQYKNASEVYTEILEKSIENSENSSSSNYHPLEIAEVHRCLGKSYLKDMQFEKAFNNFFESSKIFTSYYPEVNYSQEAFNFMTNDAYIEMLEELILLSQNEVYVDEGVLESLYSNLGDAFVRSSNNSKAISSYELALKIQKTKSHSDVFLSATLHNIGNCYYNQGEIGKSISFHEKALVLTKRAFGENHHELANSYFSLAMANQLNSNFDMAIFMYEKALMIRADTFGVDSIEVGFTLQGLALALESMGDYSQALKTCEEAIRIQKLTYIEDNSNVATLFRCLGRIHRSTDNIEKSLYYLYSALSISQKVETNDKLEIGKNHFELGISHDKRNEESERNDHFRKALLIFCSHIFSDEPGESIIQKAVIDGDDATDDENTEFNFRNKVKSYIINNENVIANADTVLYFGKLLERNKRLKLARLCYESSKKVYKDRLSSKALRFGESLYCEGRILFLLNQFNYAEKFLRDALMIRKDVLTDTHEVVEESSNTLGLVLIEVKKYNESLRLLKDTIIARMKRGGKAYPHGQNESKTLLRIGKIHHERNEYSEAMSCYEKSLDEAATIHGHKSEQIGDILFHIGDLLVDTREDDMAMYNLEKALVIFTEYNCKNPKIGNVLLRLGDLHLQRNDPDEAIIYYDKCWSHRKKFNKKKNTFSVAEVLKSLGLAYFEKRNFSLATKYCSESLQMMKQNLHRDHPEIAFCWCSLAEIYLEEKRFRESLSCFQYALRIMRLCLPKEHIDIGNVLFGIGSCLSNLNEYDKAITSFTEALRIKTKELGDDHIDISEITQNLGRTQLMLGQFENALVQFEASIRAKMNFISQNQSNNPKQILECKNCIDASLMIVKRNSGTNCEMYAIYLQKRGICLGLMKKFGPAIKSYKKAVNILTEIHGVDYIIVANLLFNLGVCMNESNNPEEGLGHLLKSLKISIEKLGDEHQDLVDILYQIGLAYEMKRMFPDATKYFENALLVLKNNSQYDTLKCALIINHIGNIAKKENSLEKSEISYKECLKIRISCLGANAMEVSDTYANLGATHLARRAYQKAIRCNEECLRIRKSKLGKRNQSVMDIYLVLGYIHDSAGNYLKAIKCYDYSLSSYKVIYGESHEFMSRVYANKGGILYKMHKLNDALSCFKDALSIKFEFTKNENNVLDDEESADIMCSLGQIHGQLGDFTQALSNYKAALSIYEKTVGKEHISVAKALHGLSVLLIKQEEIDEALFHTTEALHLRQRILGNQDVLTGDSLFCMGTIYFISKRYKESLSVLQLAYHIHSTKRGPKHLTAANDEFFIGCIYEKWNDQDRAMEIFQNCLIGRKLHLGFDHPDVGEVYSHLASIHTLKREKRNALTCLQECFRIRIRHYGRNNIHVADILVRLGDVFKDSDKTDEAVHSYSEAMEIYKLCFGEKHLKIARCYNKKGYVFSSLNDFQNVLSNIEMALQIYYSILVDKPSRKDLFHRDLKDDYLDYASSLFLLASTSDLLGDDDTAAKTYNKALRLYKHLFGRDSTQVSNILLNLAIMRGRQQKYDKAIVLLEETLRITILNYSADNENVAKVLFSMGIMFDKRNEYNAALRAYMDCLDIQRASYGDESKIVAQTLINIGVVQANKGHFKSAIECWEESILIYQKAGFGVGNEDILSLFERIKLASSLQKEGKEGKNKGLFK